MLNSEGQKVDSLVNSNTSNGVIDPSSASNGSSLSLLHGNSAFVDVANRIFETNVVVKNISAHLIEAMIKDAVKSILSRRKKDLMSTLAEPPTLWLQEQQSSP